MSSSVNAVFFFAVRSLATSASPSSKKFANFRSQNSINSKNNGNGKGNSQINRKGKGVAPVNAAGQPIRRIKNYMRWWLKAKVDRDRFYRFWRRARRQRKFKPFASQRRRLKVYRSWAHKSLKFPYHFRKVRSLVSMPHYLNHKQLFHNQMLEKQTFRKLFRLSHTQLVRNFRQALQRSKRLFDLVFIKHFELRLDTVVYRANLAFSYYQARQQVKHAGFLVNNRLVHRPNYSLNVGDCVTPVLTQVQSNKYQWMRLWARPLQMDQYPSHLVINERIPAALIFTNPKPAEIKHALPISWKFITFAMLKYT
jgi:ribosomal protein S4